MNTITYPKVSIHKGLVTVQLNPVTKVTQPMSYIMAHYTTMDEYIRELYYEAQLPFPATEGSVSQ